VIYVSDSITMIVIRSITNNNMQKVYNMGKIDLLNTIKINLPSRRKPIKGISHTKPLKRSIKKPKK